MADHNRSDKNANRAKDGAHPADADSHPVDAQPVRQGDLDEDEKLDIALQGSLMTSEPPQIAAPKRAAVEEAVERSKGN